MITSVLSPSSTSSEPIVTPTFARVAIEKQTRHNRLYRGVLVVGVPLVSLLGYALLRAPAPYL